MLFDFANFYASFCFDFFFSKKYYLWWFDKIVQWSIAMIYCNTIAILFTNKNMKIILKSTVDYFQLHFTLLRNYLLIQTGAKLYIK